MKIVYASRRVVATAAFIAAFAFTGCKKTGLYEGMITITHCDQSGRSCLPPVVNKKLERENRGRMTDMLINSLQTDLAAEKESFARSPECREAQFGRGYIKTVRTILRLGRHRAEILSQQGDFEPTASLCKTPVPEKSKVGN